MRRLAIALVPLFLFACDREPVAPSLPDISADRRTDAEFGAGTVVGEYLASCTGFDVLWDYSYQFRHNFLYDKNDDLVREQWLYHYVGDSRLYRSDDPAVFVVAVPGMAQNSHWDHVNDWLVSAGAIVKIVVPGLGPLLMETGAWKVEISTWTWLHDSGHSQLLYGDVAGLCAALTR
jgi:hypothetical protein